MELRIVVDADLCQGHGVCEAEAPELFEVDRDRKVRVLDETPDDAQRAQLELAVKYCPTHALSIVED
jgi:ferredoxin